MPGTTRRTQLIETYVKWVGEQALEYETQWRNALADLFARREFPVPGVNQPVNALPEGLKASIAARLRTMRDQFPDEAAVQDFMAKASVTRASSEISFNFSYRMANGETRGGSIQIRP